MVSSAFHSTKAVVSRPADIVSVTMPLLSIKDLAVAISTRAGPAEDDPPLYKLGSKSVQAVCKGESGALN